MKISTLFFVLAFSCLLLTNCNNKTIEKEVVVENGEQSIISTDKHLLNDFEPIADNGDINVVVEIPAGTLEKWEVEKIEGNLSLEYIDSKPRIVQYLAYPGNYGMIPRTLLPKELGGDGDPLDVLVLGDASERGSIIQCKVIGVLKMLDRGEQDDKLIAVKKDSPFYQINSIEELDKEFIGVTSIISTWFSNYKGPDMIEVIGFEEKGIADKILESAINEFEAK